jgi:hypothetical protein
VLGAEANSDQPGRNSPQNGPAAQKFQGPRKGKGLGAAENPPDHVVLYGDLQPLRGSCWKTSALLDGAKIAFGRSLIEKYPAE